MKKLISLAVALATLTCLTVACNDDDNSHTYVYADLIITDAPTLGDFSEVNLSFAGLRYFTKSGGSGVQRLTKSTAYNFLDLMNGQDSLLVKVPMLYGDSINQVQIFMGNVNELVTSDGETIEMDATLAQNNGVFIPVVSYALNYQVDDPQIIIDLDLQKSIQLENGTYYFRPQGRSYFRQGTYYIEGWVEPSTTSFVVSTLDGQNDTITTITDPSNNNYFRLSGLPTNSYTLTFEPQYGEGSFEQEAAISKDNVSLGNINTNL